MNLLEEYNCVNKIDGVEFRYSYKLIKNNYKGINGYGIQIERKDYSNLKVIGSEKDSIELISTQRHKVKELLMKLYTNVVSPIHLVDIIGNYVDEHVYEFDNNKERQAMS